MMWLVIVIIALLLLGGFSGMGGLDASIGGSGVLIVVALILIVWLLLGL